MSDHFGTLYIKGFYMSAKVPSGISDCVQNVPLMVDTTQLLKFKGDISLTASKEGIIL